MTATTEQLLAMLREEYGYMEHPKSCRSWLGEFENCTCGLRALKARVQDALANHSEAPKSSTGDDDGN